MASLEEKVKAFCQQNIDIAQAFVLADEISIEIREADKSHAWDNLADFLMAAMNRELKVPPRLIQLEKILGPAIVLQAYRLYLIAFKEYGWQPLPGYLYEINKLIDLVYEANLPPPVAVEVYSLQELARQAKEKQKKSS